MDLTTVRFMANLFLILGVLLLLKLAKTGRASFVLTSYVELLFFSDNMRESLGISLKSQELYLAAFVSRYLNMFQVFTATPRSYLAIKLLLLGSTTRIIWILRRSVASNTTDNHIDDRSCLYLLIPSVAVGVVVQYVEAQVFEGPRFELNMDLLFTISLFIEMVAMLPQLALFRSETTRTEDQQQGSRYAILPSIACFATYRMLYVVNWLLIASMGSHHHHLYVNAACGVIQKQQLAAVLLTPISPRNLYSNAFLSDS
eukprot:scaffold1386_cov89-Cylindrotheca_fusiformis.AAC.2